MKTLNYNFTNGILANSLAEFQSFNFLASKFMGISATCSTERTISFSSVSLYGYSLWWESFIRCLFFPSRPFAIRKSVMKIVVNSVNSGICFSKKLAVNFVRFIHILLKFFKRLPKILYSSTSIILKRFMFWFSASANNLSIDVIKSISIHSVFGGSFSQGIGSRTSTRSSMSVLEVVSPSSYISTTFTRTQKNTTSFFSGYKTFYRKFIKFLSNQVLKFTHASSLSRWLGFVNVNGGDNHISGKVDTNNPIYRFYEKDVAKYLNKFGGKRVVDDKGVSWIEIPITKEQGNLPVEAFGIVPVLGLPRSKEKE